MDLDLFTRCLDTFGADFRRWPEAGRAAAEQLLASSPPARERWDAARRLDALFELDRTVSPDSAAHTAIINAALRRIRMAERPVFDWHWLLARPMRAALATTLAAGLLLGFLLEPQWLTPPPQGVVAMNALLGDGSGDLEELF